MTNPNQVAEARRKPGSWGYLRRRLGPDVGLSNGTTGITVTVADRFWSRLMGLQFKRPLPPGRGLLLVPCGSVHTIWLRFPLDLAMVGDGGVVLAVRRSVRPWRVALAPRGTRAVLEATGGTLAVAAGDRLATDDRRPSLRFLSREPKVGTPA